MGLERKYTFLVYILSEMQSNIPIWAKKIPPL